MGNLSLQEYKNIVLGLILTLAGGLAWFAFSFQETYTAGFALFVSVPIWAIAGGIAVWDVAINLALLKLMRRKFITDDDYDAAAEALRELRPEFVWTLVCWAWTIWVWVIYALVQRVSTGG